MSKASKIVILCEDRAHELFVTRFLKKGWNIPNRMIRVLPYPKGKGSGKRHVETRISVEAEAVRKRQASTVLLVVRDADEDSLSAVRATLDNKIASRTPKELIAYVVPKWHIQTWIAYLDGKAVDEAEKKTYEQRYGDISVSKDAHALIDKLAVHCKEKKELDSPPASLVEACKEFERIRGALQ